MLISRFAHVYVLYTSSRNKVECRALRQKLTNSQFCNVNVIFMIFLKCFCKINRINGFDSSFASTCVRRLASGITIAVCPVTNFRADKKQASWKPRGHRARERTNSAKRQGDYYKGAHYNTSPCQRSLQSTAELSPIFRTPERALCLYSTRGSDDISRRGDFNAERISRAIDGQTTRVKRQGAVLNLRQVKLERVSEINVPWGVRKMQKWTIPNLESVLLTGVIRKLYYQKCDKHLFLSLSLSLSLSLFFST